MDGKSQKGAFIVFEGLMGQAKRCSKPITSSGDISLRSGCDPDARTWRIARRREEIRRLMIVEGDADRWDDAASCSDLCCQALSYPGNDQAVHYSRNLGNLGSICRFLKELSGRSEDNGLEVVEKIHREVVGDFSPNLTLILDIDLQSPCKELSKRRREVRFEQKGLEYQSRVE